MESAGLIGLDYKYKSKWKERNYQLYDAVLTVILLGVASTMMLINRIKSWVKQKN